VTASGDLQLKKVLVSPELLKDADPAMVQDLFMTAANQALAKAQEMAAAEMSKITGGFKLPF
jgi:DNA-binding protein YbaB